jgi:hypothetical protein
MALAYESLYSTNNNPDDLLNARSAYENALGIYTREKYPYDYGAIKINIATVFLKMAEAGKGEFYDYSREAIEEALNVFTVDTYPRDYALARITQGDYYYKFSLSGQADKKENLDMAVGAYKEALKVFSEATYPDDYAIIQEKLALVYAEIEKQ